MRTIQHWIDGAETRGSSTRTGAVFNPATGEQQAEVLLAEQSDVDRAVAAAAAAFEEWSESSLSRRTRVLFAFREIVNRRVDELAAAITDEHGRIVNLGALDYRIPTTKDVPLELHSLLVENEDGPGPYGAKGAGEGGLFAVSPAVAAAVTEATGAVLRDLPLTPERVWRALHPEA